MRGVELRPDEGITKIPSYPRGKNLHKLLNRRAELPPAWYGSGLNLAKSLFLPG
jgi:hypothetical protein